MSILKAMVGLMIQIGYLLERIGKLRGVAGDRAIRNITDCDSYLSKE